MQVGFEPGSHVSSGRLLTLHYIWMFLQSSTNWTEIGSMHVKFNIIGKESSDENRMNWTLFFVLYRVEFMCSSFLIITLQAEWVSYFLYSLSVSPYPGAMVCGVLIS